MIDSTEYSDNTHTQFNKEFIVTHSSEQFSEISETPVTTDYSYYGISTDYSQQTFPGGTASRLKPFKPTISKIPYFPQTWLWEDIRSIKSPR